MSELIIVGAVLLFWLCVWVDGLIKFYIEHKYPLPEKPRTRKDVEK